MSLVTELLIDFIYPKSCLGCGKAGVFLCKDCLRNFEYADQICPECGGNSPYGWTHTKCKKKLGLDGLVCVFNYQDEGVRKMIDEIKFGFNRELVGEVIDTCKVEIGEDFDYVIPIPLHYYRENWRGFNQSEEIARNLGQLTGLELCKGLTRNRMTKQQSLSASKEERFDNIKGAFGAVNKGKLKGKKVLLIDDVFTSGATLREACKELKRNGVKVVWGFCLAH